MLFGKKGQPPGAATVAENIAATVAATVAENVAATVAGKRRGKGRGKRRGKSGGKSRDKYPIHQLPEPAPKPSPHRHLAMALRAHKKPLNVTELAIIMGVSVGESSRRIKAAESILDVERRGRCKYVVLKSLPMSTYVALFR